MDLLLRTSRTSIRDTPLIEDKPAPFPRSSSTPYQPHEKNTPKMISIGKYEIVLTDTLLVPKDEKVEIIQSNKKNESFKLHIFFKEEEKTEKDDDSRRPKFTCEPVDEIGVLTFTNWTKPLGSTLNRPIPFAMLDSGRELSILANVTLTGEIYRATIQLMLAPQEKNK